MEKTKIAYFDIDRTLVGFGSKSISEESRSALKRIPMRGVNTLRNIEDAKQPFAEGDLNLPYITLNGAQVWSLSGELIYSLSIDRVTLKKITASLAKAREHLVEVKAYSSNKKRVVIYTKTLERGMEILAEYPETMPVELVTEIEKLVDFLSQQGLSYLGIRFDDTFDKFELPELSAIKYKLSKNDTKISIYPKEASKLKTLRWVCENVLKVDVSEILTVGDDYEVDGEIFADTLGVSVGDEKHPHARHHTTFEKLPSLLQELFSE